jgi:hypothetical protein
VATPGTAHHALETLDARAKTLAELSVILAEVGADHALIGGIAVGYHARLRARDSRGSGPPTSPSCS